MPFLAFAVFPAAACLGVILVASIDYALRPRGIARPVDVRHAILHERTLSRVSAR